MTTKQGHRWPTMLKRRAAQEDTRPPRYALEGVAFKCSDGEHRWRLNARPGDRCFCGKVVRS